MSQIHMILTANISILKRDTDKKKRNSKRNKTLKMKQGQNKQYKH